MFRIPTLEQFITESKSGMNDGNVFRKKASLRNFLCWYGKVDSIPVEVSMDSDVIKDWAEMTNIGDSDTHLEASQAYELFKRFGDDPTTFYSEKEGNQFKITYNLGTLEMVTVALNPPFEGEPVNEKEIVVHPEEKDFMRIRDIMRKAAGNESKEQQLARNMAASIKDGPKMLRRYRAAQKLAGEDSVITKEFRNGLDRM